MTLDGLKTEALDAFGLFDVSIGEASDMLDDGHSLEERKSDHMKSVFKLSVRVTPSPASNS